MYIYTPEPTDNKSTAVSGANKPIEQAQWVNSKFLKKNNIFGEKFYLSLSLYRVVFFSCFHPVKNHPVPLCDFHFLPKNVLWAMEIVNLVVSCKDRCENSVTSEGQLCGSDRPIFH